MRRLNKINKEIVQTFGSEKLKSYLLKDTYSSYENIDTEIKNSIREILFRNQAVKNYDNSNLLSVVSLCAYTEKKIETPYLQQKDLYKVIEDIEHIDPSIKKENLGLFENNLCLVYHYININKVNYCPIILNPYLDNYDPIFYLDYDVISDKFIVNIENFSENCLEHQNIQSDIERLGLNSTKGVRSKEIKLKNCLEYPTAKAIFNNKSKKIKPEIWDLFSEYDF